MRHKLMKIGARVVHKKKLYKRSVFTRCNGDIKGYSRVRKEGNDTTMTVKIYKDPKFPEEYEVNIKDKFETGVDFLKALGVSEKAYQESIREKWKHPLAHEITFDTIPGLPTYMEIDCLSEDKLNELVKLLELDETKKRFGSFDHTYLEYYGIPKDIINERTPFLTFANIQNEIKPTKNLKLFQKICKLHNKVDAKMKVIKKLKNHNN